MVSIQYSNAMAEVEYYLKGIRKEDIDKIPKKLIDFIQENASKSYECKFDYSKPLKELDLLDETRGLIGMICYNYWCETKKQKMEYLNKLSENEKKYQEELTEKYNPDNVFNKKEIQKENNLEERKNIFNIVKYKKENIFKRILNFFKKVHK